MKKGITPKSIAIWFFVVLILYLCTFYGAEYWRHRKGPWEVNFVTDSEGNPSIVIYQPKLNISSVELLFPGEKLASSNLSQRVAFDRPLNKVVFGRVLYEDLTVLPGVVTFDLFGHEIELLPRTLIINKKEVPWKSESVIEMSQKEKPPQPPKPAHPNGKRA
jgi:hypothetical protein